MPTTNPQSTRLDRGTRLLQVHIEHDGPTNTADELPAVAGRAIADILHVLSDEDAGQALRLALMHVEAEREDGSCRRLVTLP